MVVLAGPGVENAAREQGILADLLRPEKSVFRLCPDGSVHDLIGQLTLLRMRLSGRSTDAPETVGQCAEALGGAHYAVVAWSAAQLNEPAIEMLCGLIEALNAKSRAAGLPLPPPANAMGASQVSAWLTGFPLPVGFVRGMPEHDPWRFSAPRMIESGEADAVLWVGALETRSASMPMITLGAVEIEVGCPGVDHPGVVYQPRLGALASLPARLPSTRPSAAAVAGRNLGGAAVMLTCLRGGRVIDPTRTIDGIGDVWFEDGRIVASPGPARAADSSIDASGMVVLAGGIDIHSHVGSAGVTAARLLLPELRENGDWDATPVSARVGRAYAAMGFTLVVEPAVLPHQATQAQLELAAIPLIDTAMLVVLGNDDYLLGLLRVGESDDAVADYAARTLAGSRAIGIKCINPGGSVALKANVRRFGLDDTVPDYGVSSRAIMQALQRAVGTLGRSPSAAPALQQSRRAGKCRDCGGHDRRGGRRAAAPRAPAVLRLRHGGKARVLLCRRAAGGSGECGATTSPPMSAR